MNKVGRPQSVSKMAEDSNYIVYSKVKSFKNGGAYIPLPKRFAGQKVTIILLEGVKL